MSVDAALGSDVPFDPRLNEVRGQPGQVRVAGRQRALLAGSAIRASHLVDCERVQDPYSLRCQPQVMGACLDLLTTAGADARARGARRLRQPAGVRARSGRRGRRDPLGRQLPCRAGGLRGRPDRAGAGRDRLARRAPHRAADRSRALRPAGVPDARARPQLRLHAARRSPRPRSPARTSISPTRWRSTAGRPRPTRRTTSAWRPTPRDASSRWPRTPPTSSRSSCSPPPRASSCAGRCAAAPPLEAALASVRRHAAFLTDDRPLAPEIAALARGGAGRRLRSRSAPCCRRAG